MDMGSELQSGTSPRRAEASSRWAPWWVYVIVIAPANMAKEQLLSSEVGWPVRAALTVALVAAGIAVVTAVHRASRGEGGGRAW
jgi:hypothetical protein